MNNQILKTPPPALLKIAEEIAASGVAEIHEPMSKGSLLYRLFLQGFRRTLGLYAADSADENNLYLRQYPTSQIDIFSLLSIAMPLVTRASESANQLLASVVCGADSATLIDFGIGKGRQMIDLLRLLERGDHRIIYLAGIDPSSESIRYARNAIAELSRSLPFEVRFLSFEKAAEDLEPAAWRILSRLPRPIAINAAFSMHHVRSASKSEVLRKIKNLNANAFVLTEPHADHETSDYLRRFAHAWHHYGLVFDVIDAQGLDKNMRDAMKMQFFAREIEDVLSRDEKCRSERHELLSSWIERLRAERMSPIRFPEPINGSKEFGSIVRKDHGTYLSFDFEDEPVVSQLFVN